MRYYLLPILLLLPLYAQAEIPSLDSMAFAAKHQINSNAFKNAKYVQGNTFPLGKHKTAYELFYSGKYKGRSAVMQINCKAVNKTGDIEYCKPVDIK
ncbi:hypothetical protein FR932_00120 (plasmid) [Moritella marina ATCC 15381]|uniref:Uncharacterized protein n=1 Tax=Moritella marina ATCC 15381 TaxID=1202962 RepID=A0A5J6WGU3_MORMI|nr:hypothetical protein [Moritella marina]QFI36331.1 hypothetical protein FR932_00120 [Moritella marina ATCC 15381]